MKKGSHERRGKGIAGAYCVHDIYMGSFHKRMFLGGKYMTSMGTAS